MTLVRTSDTGLIGLQRRMVEVGRIRLGEKKKTDAGKEYPSKLAKPRLTSKDRTRLEAAAAEYGGKVQAWEDQWEVYTEVDSFDIAVLPGQALTQSYEHWGQEKPKGQKNNPVICLRRCNGAQCMIPNPAGRGWVEKTCVCADSDEMLCKPHTRLSVILTKIPGLGVWRLESKGWNAAAELAGSVQLLEVMIASNRPVRARLSVEIVTQVTRQGTFKYPKPRLDIDHTLEEITAIAGVAPPPAQLEQPSAPAASFSPVPVHELGEGPGGTLEEQLHAGRDQEPSGRSEPIKPTGRKPRPAAEVSEAPVDGPAGVEDDGEESGRSLAGGTVPDSSPSTSDDSPPDDAPGGAGMPQFQIVAMWCADVGLDDTARHAFLEAFSRVIDPDQVYRSSKDVPHEHMPALRRALDRLKNEDLTLVISDDEKVAPILVDKAGEQVISTGTPVPPAGIEGEWNRARWRAACKKIPGVGEVKLLKEARKIAAELGIALPSDLDGVTDEQLVIRCLTWLRDQR